MIRRPERRFYFRLALALGRPVGEMLSTMSSHELAEWMAFERVEGPVGEMRDDLRTGIMASTVANVNRKRGSRPFTPADFMPYKSPAGVVKMSEAAMKDTLYAFAAAQAEPTEGA